MHDVTYFFLERIPAGRVEGRSIKSLRYASYSRTGKDANGTQ